MKNTIIQKSARNKAGSISASDHASPCPAASTQKTSHVAEPTGVTHSECQQLDVALKKAAAILDMVCAQDEEENRLKVTAQYALVYVRRAAQCHAVPGLDSAISSLERGLKEVGNALVPKPKGENDPIG